MLLRIDRERVARVTAKIDDCYRKAETAATPAQRDRYLRAAHGFERTRRYYRTFPLGIALISASVTAIIVPWAVFTRSGAPLPGVVVSLVVAIGIVALVRQGKRKRDLRADEGN